MAFGGRRLLINAERYPPNALKNVEYMLPVGTTNMTRSHLFPLTKKSTVGYNKLDKR
jgi:hypothetical protein